MHNAPSIRLRRLPRISLRSLAAATLITSAFVVTAPAVVSAGGPCVVDAVDDGQYPTPFETQLNEPASGVLINDTPCGLTPAYGVASSGAFAGNLDGSFSFTPAAGFSGIVTVPYSLVSIDQIPIDTATISIFVAAPPCQPVLNDDAYETPFDTPLNVAAPGYAANDPETCGRPYQLVSSTSSGVLVFNTDGSFGYTPNAGFIGVDQFVYTIEAPPVPGLRGRLLGFRMPQGVPTDDAIVTITIAGPPATTTTTTTPPTTPTTVPAPTTTIVTGNTLPPTR